MKLSWSTWTSLALLALGTNASPGGDHYKPSPPPDDHDKVCYGKTTVFHTKTVEVPTTIPVTHYVDVKVSQYVTVTVSSTTTSIVETCVTEYSTTTLHYTVNITKTDVTTITNTETDLATVTNTKTDQAVVTNTKTDVAVITNTKTDIAIVTNTQTTTATVPATITTYTTQTIFSTTYDPCPSTCSISAATVNLFFWPTDRPYSYPSTWVDTNLGYTFTSPSVYMMIPTAKGINSASAPVGPATSKWILPLDLWEVSTIVDGASGSLTRQLTLSDLGTDCPQTAEPSAIATMVDPRCDPILAAPRQVSSWAYPCNACGRFGLFDPPYAVPTLPGGLVETTTSPLPVQTTAPVPSTTPTPPPPPSSPPSSSLSGPAPTSAIPSSTIVPASAAVLRGSLAWLFVTALSVVLFL